MTTKRKPARKAKAKPVRKIENFSNLPPLSTSQLARLLNVTTKTIVAWASAGVVKRIAHGRYDLALSVQGFARHMKAIADAKGDGSVSIERGALLRVQRQRAELSLAKDRGDLVERAEIMRDFDENCRHVRLQLQMLHGYLVNSGVDQALATTVVDRVLDGVKIIEDGGSLSDHGGYDREGKAYHPVPDELEAQP